MIVEHPNIKEINCDPEFLTQFTGPSSDAKMHTSCQTLSRNKKGNVKMSGSMVIVGRFSDRNARFLRNQEIIYVPFG